MEHSDRGLVLKVAKFGEQDAVIKIFGSRGLYSGIFKYGFSKKNQPLIIIGNLVEFTWYARRSEHLGKFSHIELETSYFAKLYSRSISLMLLNLFTAMLALIIPEREEESELFEEALSFLAAIAERGFTDEDLIIKYLTLELRILTYTGFALDLSRCAATGRVDNLLYISPKTGRAVSEEAGREYHEKMLPLPKIYRNPLANWNESDIFEADMVNKYFIEKHLFEAREIRLLDLRKDFSQYLLRRYSKSYA